MHEIFQNENARALIAGLLLAIAAAPIGVFLVIRRMSLVGDALGHAVLPGATLGALLSGGATWAISLGAAITGSLLFGLAARLQNRLRLQEDAVFALFYLGSLSLGLIIANKGGDEVHLEEILFGHLMSLDNFALLLCALAAIISTIAIFFIYQPLLANSVDKNFLANSPKIKNAKVLFYIVLALVSVASFQALGTLLSVGLFIGPAICAKYWGKSVKGQIIASAIFGILAIIIGILISLAIKVSPSPIIVLLLVISAFTSAIIKADYAKT